MSPALERADVAWVARVCTQCGTPLTSRMLTLFAAVNDVGMIAYVSPALTTVCSTACLRAWADALLVITRETESRGARVVGRVQLEDAP